MGSGRSRRWSSVGPTGLGATKENVISIGVAWKFVAPTVLSLGLLGAVAPPASASDSPVNDCSHSTQYHNPTMRTVPVRQYTRPVTYVRGHRIPAAHMHQRDVQVLVNGAWVKVASRKRAC